MPHLTTVTLARGVLDIGDPLPAEDVTLLAPAANLVVRSDVHAAIVPILINAAREVHEGGGLVSDAGLFPSLQLSDRGSRMIWSTRGGGRKSVRRS